MGTVDAVLVDLVRDELRRSTDRGEVASRAGLQAACGMGAGDLQAALDALRMLGEASEQEPDGFVLLGGDVVDAPEGIRLGEDSDEDALRSAAPAGRGIRRDEFGATTAIQIGKYREEFGGQAAQVVMPRAVADVLDAASLGALLKAGIDTSPPGATFVFEVTP